MSLKDMLPAGASYELSSRRTKTSEVSYEGNRFERSQSSDHVAETLRLLHQGRLSTAISSKPGSKEELMQKHCSDVCNFEICNTEKCTLQLLKNGINKSVTKIGNQTYLSYIAYVKDADGRTTGHIEIFNKLNRE